MRLMLDLNVLLDIVQRREPFYEASAGVLSRVVGSEDSGYLPSHGITTLHYIIQRFSGREQADGFVDWLLSHLEIAAQEKAQFIRARSLSMPDFEDAAVASAAEFSQCDVIISRNVADFEGSPVQAMTPEEFLAAVAERKT
jgi:predicted nucleic acid-binding protein